ncbi:MAG: dicarboxylate/amino acid:cation symporter [Candidatus Latescibacterota bacterium]
MQLWKKILIGLVLGIVTGLALGERALHLKPMGDLFINALKMLIGPLVFASLVSGVTSMNDLRKLGRVGLKIVIYFMITTAGAVTIGLILGVLFRPGAGVNLQPSAPAATTKVPNMIETLVTLVPSNPVQAFATDNILQVIVFALLFGLAINIAGDKGKPVARIIDSLSEVMIRLTGMVMAFAPFGVFALMAWVSGKFGIGVLLPLGKVILVVYAGCVLHAVLTYGGLIALLGRVNPLRFFRGMADAQLVAFSTASSAGTLPVNLRCTQQNLGVSESISSFVLPLGATLNMDGTAIYQGVTALFIAQVYGIELTFTHYVTIVISATLASIGTAGVPGAGMIMLSLVLSSVGLPLEGVALIAGIDRILDMIRTTVNITGDAAGSVIIARSEGELNVEVYNGGRQAQRRKGTEAQRV